MTTYPVVETDYEAACIADGASAIWGTWWGRRGGSSHDEVYLGGIGTIVGDYLDPTYADALRSFTSGHATFTFPGTGNTRQLTMSGRDSWAIAGGSTFWNSQKFSIDAPVAFTMEMWMNPLSAPDQNNNVPFYIGDTNSNGAGFLWAANGGGNGHFLQGLFGGTGFVGAYDLSAHTNQSLYCVLRYDGAGTAEMMVNNASVAIVALSPQTSTAITWTQGDFVQSHMAIYPTRLNNTKLTDHYTKGTVAWPAFMAPPGGVEVEGRLPITHLDWAAGVHDPPLMRATVRVGPSLSNTWQATFTPHVAAVFRGPTPCTLHVPHKEWAGDNREMANYLAIERFSTYFNLNNFSSPPIGTRWRGSEKYDLLIPYKDWADDPRELANYNAIESWLAYTLRHITGTTTGRGSSTKYDLHIPFKDWADDLEFQNYLEIERWASWWVRHCITSTSA